MKGFRDSSKMRSGFSFGSRAGFSASTGKTQNISYTRKTPHRKPKAFAEGGRVVDSAMQGRTPPSSALDAESGGTSPLRPGFKRGGRTTPRYAKGGLIPAHKVAAMEAKKALSKHVATPAPKGHKGLKGC